MTQNASRIYNELIKFGSQYCRWSDVRHLGVMVWMMVGMITTGSVNLTIGDQPYQYKSIVRPKYTKATIKMAEQSKNKSRKAIQSSN